MSATITRGAWVPGRAAISGDDAHAASLDVAVLDVGLRQGLVAVQRLGRAGLRVGSIECGETTPVPAFASRWCAAHATVPERDTTPEAMVDALLDLIEQRAVRAIIPTHDGTIEAISARRKDFEGLCAVALASPAALDVVIDKDETLAIAEELGVRIPRAVHVRGEDDIARAAAEVGLPAVVKPTRSWVAADNEAHRLSPIAVVTIAEAHAAVAELRAAGADVLFQEWIPGAREAVSFVYARGQFFGEFAQLATRMVPILGGNSVARESIPLPYDAAESARRLVRAIDLEGYAEVEFRRDRAGQPVLMEINPRLSASVEVAIRAGVDFPCLLHAWATGGRIDRAAGYRTGVRMRWLGGDIRWLVDSVRAQDRPDAFPTPRALWSFTRDFARPSGYDYLTRDDLRPAAVATWGALGSTWKIVERRLARRHARS